jgi:hypothetical protein
MWANGMSRERTAGRAQAAEAAGNHEAARVIRESMPQEQEMQRSVEVCRAVREIVRMYAPNIIAQQLFYA